MRKSAFFSLPSVTAGFGFQQMAGAAGKQASEAGEWACVGHVPQVTAGVQEFLGLRRAASTVSGVQLK